MDTTIVITDKEISNGLTDEKLERIEKIFGDEFLLVQYLNAGMVVSEYHLHHVFDEPQLKPLKTIWAKANLDDLRNPVYRASLSEMVLNNQYTKAIHDIGLATFGSVTLNVKDLEHKRFPNLKWFKWITLTRPWFGDKQITVFVHDRETLPADLQDKNNLTFNTSWVMMMGSSFWPHLIGKTQQELLTGLKHVEMLYENASVKEVGGTEEIQVGEVPTSETEFYTIEEIKKVLNFLGLDEFTEDFESALKLIAKQRK